MIQATDLVTESRSQEVTQVTKASPRRRVVLSEEERIGLRRILSTPKPPTDALRTAVANYQQFMAQASK